MSAVDDNESHIILYRHNKGLNMHIHIIYKILAKALRISKEKPESSTKITIPEIIMLYEY